MPAQIDILPLLQQIGPAAAVAVFAALTYFIIARQVTSTRTDAQNTLNHEFAKAQADNAELRRRLDTLHDDMAKLREDYAVGKQERARMADQMAAAAIDAQKAADELKAATEALSALRAELADLRVKLTALESEKRRNFEALEAERVQVARLTQQTKDMQGEIDTLRLQMTRLEGENAGLRAVLSALRVVTVETNAVPAQETP